MTSMAGRDYANKHRATSTKTIQQCNILTIEQHKVSRRDGTREWLFSSDLEAHSQVLTDPCSRQRYSN
jgi:hypothetical protein